MATTTLTYENTFSSLEELQDRVQNDECNVPGKLKTLRAKNGGGDRITEATYAKQVDVDGGLGDVTLEEGGDDSAWIDDVDTSISINP